jgi:nicotinamide mononucleotide transporter
MQDIISQFKQTSMLEWYAFVLGIAQVWLARYNLRVNFLAGASSAGIFTWLFMISGLYAESCLNAYYVVISFIGYWMWGASKGKEERAISVCRKKEHAWSFLFFIGLFIAQYLILRYYTDSTVPQADALVSALAWVGSALLIYRKLESWLWLSASNILGVPLLLYKDLQLSAILTIVFLVVGLMGYQSWRKQISSQKNAITA